MEAFKPGDVVVLKSGGPKMTVEGSGSSGREVTCVWFAEEDVQRGVFAPETLRKLESEGAGIMTE
jgi:uncharacterized protein YodC (DUF2158 family)